MRPHPRYRLSRSNAASPLLIALCCLTIFGEALAGGDPIVSRTQEPIAPGSPDDSPSPRLSFTVVRAELAAGSLGEVTIGTKQPLALSQGRLTLRFDPPAFAGMPRLEFPSSIPSGRYVLGSPAEGVYTIDFAAGAAPLNTVAGDFVKVSGMTRDDLPVGSRVTLEMEASATSSSGAPAQVISKGATLVVQAEDPLLILRVNDAASLVPGGTVDIVVRTYNPKPIKQGQLCLKFDSDVFDRVLSVQVIGTEPDITYSIDTSSAGMVEVGFASPSSSVNRLDGPMLLITMLLRDNLPPGLETWIDLDLGRTLLVDRLDHSVPLESRSGKFKLSS